MVLLSGKLRDIMQQAGGPVKRKKNRRRAWIMHGWQHFRKVLE
jgi:hypothetical protein